MCLQESTVSGSCYETHLQILNEDSGELIKSVEVDAANFTFDTKGNIVLLNLGTKELNYFSSDGSLFERKAINYDGCCYKLSLTKDDQPVFCDSENILFF